MKAYTPGQYSRIQFPGMSLHLIPMLVYTSEKVGPAVYIKHYPPPLLSAIFPPGIIASHLNPFCLQYATLHAPLPPLTSSDLINPMMS